MPAIRILLLALSILVLGLATGCPTETPADGEEGAHCHDDDECNGDLHCHIEDGEDEGVCEGAEE
ncbi:MAG: hypothetical protein GY898_10280 [Proteobacteria bacterium]|nr:hypothetical protein [Pseudomonadota bacterium]